MSNETIVSLLDNYSDAVRAEEFTRASETLDELLAEYHSIRGVEAAVTRQAIVARDQSDVSQEAREALDTVAQAYLGTQFGRSGFIATAGAYETAPAEVDTPVLGDRANELAEREQQFVDREASAQEVLETVEVPAALAVMSVISFREPIPLGVTQTINAVVKNVGDIPAEDVTITASGSIFPSPVSESVRTLSSGETIEFSTDVEMTEPGDAEMTVNATAAEADGDNRSQTFEVLGKRGFATAAMDRIRFIRSRIEENDAISRGRQQSLVTKLDAAIDSIERAVDAAAEGNEKRANNALNTAMKQLGAFLNEFGDSKGEKARKGQGGPGSNLSEDFRGSVIRSVENVIDTLNTSKTAIIAD